MEFNVAGGKRIGIFFYIILRNVRLYIGRRGIRKLVKRCNDSRTDIGNEHGESNIAAAWLHFVRVELRWDETDT